MHAYNTHARTVPRTYTRCITLQAGSNAHWSQKLLPRGALYVTPNQTFRDVLNLLNDGNLHRVFVCSTASEDRGLPVPIAVITQTDVIRTVMIALGCLQG